MSDRERAAALLDRLPDYQMRIVVGILQGIIDATEDIPNDETIAAIEELERGDGVKFDTVDALFEDLGV